MVYKMTQGLLWRLNRMLVKGAWRPHEPWCVAQIWMVLPRGRQLLSSVSEVCYTHNRDRLCVKYMDLNTSHCHSAIADDLSRNVGMSHSFSRMTKKLRIFGDRMVHLVPYGTSRTKMRCCGCSTACNMKGTNFPRKQLILLIALWVCVRVHVRVRCSHTCLCGSV